MKKSNQLLGAVIMVPFIIILVIVIYLRVLISSDFVESDQDYFDYSKETITEKLDFQDFTEIDLRGSWKAEIVQGTGFNVEIVGPEDRVKRVRSHIVGNSLYLSESKFRRSNGPKLEIKITLPMLEEISLVGNSRVYLSNFSENDFRISVKGSGRVVGQNCTFVDLDLSCTGSADVDLTECAVTNANVYLAGAVTAELTMSGGYLGGNAIGAARVIYYGDVSQQDIRTSGGSSVKKH